MSNEPKAAGKHNTLFSDFSFCDVCMDCGATDASGDDRLNLPCPGKNVARQEGERAGSLKGDAAALSAVEEVNALPIFDVNLHAIAIRHAEELDRLREQLKGGVVVPRELAERIVNEWGDADVSV